MMLDNGGCWIMSRFGQNYGYDAKRGRKNFIRSTFSFGLGFVCPTLRPIFNQQVIGSD
jgi:hypothetical protein